MQHYYHSPGLSTSHIKSVQSRIKLIDPQLQFEISTELCYNVGVKSTELESNKEACLKWLLAPSFQKNSLSKTSHITKSAGDSTSILVEYGPRLNFATAFSTNAVSICQRIGLNEIHRIEVSRRYLFNFTDINGSTDIQKIMQGIQHLLYDRMTEIKYLKPLTSFTISQVSEEIYEIPIMTNGVAALTDANEKLGLALDEWDIQYYHDLFSKELHRNPTNVECFDLAQSNSEHSRHWYFKGKMVIDGVEMEKCLMQLVMDTQNHTNSNSVIKFSDNSSAILGYRICTLIPKDPSEPCIYLEKDIERHILFTAETHNFPTGVAPFPGATTGTGGRIRDTHSTGRGSHVIAGTAGYCFGNLHIPGYNLPWEEELDYPSNFASPLDIIIDASNGASDYGNKFGEPVICGFARSFGLVMPDSERREWIKPIMFSGGLGSIDGIHIDKKQAEKGMKVVKIGGPVYRIGVGGGAASSIQIQGDNAEELDFGAVQRGDAEMAQKLNRFIRACIECGDKNPICSIHDQGAGGNGNVLKEICEPAGAIIRAGEFQLGDPTLSLLEIWGAEYQESDAILVKDEDEKLLRKISEREKVNVSFVGDITGDGTIILEDTRLPSELSDSCNKNKIDYAVNLPLDIVLAKMPQKVYQLKSITPVLKPLELSSNLTVYDALNRVLRLPSVASKRYLTNKVDRSVTGLIAQQQCVGPLHTPLADVAVVALSHFNTVGSATAIGEQPIKMLIDATKGARLSVAEAFTNLVFAKISDIKDVKCSGNWMWPAKLPGEGSRMYDACMAMSTMLSEIGAAVDGGKDSLSMAARVNQEVVKAPGSLVLSVYAPCPDIRLTITPDLKCNDSCLLYVNMCGNTEWKLGGSAIAQVFNQVGDEVPDVSDMQLFVKAFETVQKLIQDGCILSGHDVSDGGFITTILEMCFAGNKALQVDVSTVVKNRKDAFKFLFAEHPGIVLEVAQDQLETVQKVFVQQGVEIFDIGVVRQGTEVIVRCGDVELLRSDLRFLRQKWEATSFQLERLQCNPTCVESEEKTLDLRHLPEYIESYEVSLPTERENSGDTPAVAGFQREEAVLSPQIAATLGPGGPKVAVIREEGSNGDREMVSCLHLVGFDVYDVTMQDLCKGNISLDIFRGVVFVGGFSYADVFGSAKGWASTAQYNETVLKELSAFRKRSDTFSLGVCNGCQLMALLGWVGNGENCEQQVCFTHNISERFESRYVNVKVLKSPSIMLEGLEDFTMGVWVAHGEGRVEEKEKGILQKAMGANLTPLRYVDDNGEITTTYPFNPNGSIAGIAAMCSDDGRHLAMMPHPERSFLTWQLPWIPDSWKDQQYTPWMKMFRNARLWCDTQSLKEHEK